MPGTFRFALLPNSTLSRGNAWLWAAAVLGGLLVAAGCDSSGDEGNRPPEAQFAISEDSPRAGQEVTLDASASSDPDGEIASYQWDFGADGEVEKTGPQVTWRFDAEAALVRLTVADAEGAEGTAERTPDLQPGVEAAFTYAPGDPRAGQEVMFDASSSEEPLGDVQGYAWDFDGDGETDANGETASWTFSYRRGDLANVELTVTGEDDVEGVAEQDVPLQPLLVDISVLDLRIAQGVQRSGDQPRVPLVAGRDGFMRIYLSADENNPYEPDLDVHFYHDGALVETITSTAERSISTSPGVFYLGSTRNLEVPGELIQPGLSIRVEVDPAGEVPVVEGSQSEYPASGDPLPLDVRDVPPFELTMVPVKVARSGNTGNISESNLGSYLEAPRDLFPISSIDASVHSVYTSSAIGGGDFTYTLISEIAALRAAEGGSGHYYGVFPGSEPTGGIGGLGYRPGWVSVGVEEAPITFAHELGHNLNRRHAPCGGPSGIDPNYPYANADIGIYGLEVDEGEMRAPDEWKDLMSYCGPEWISDYTYTAILNYRQAVGGANLTSGGGGEEPVMLVWGRMKDGEFTLEPAFALDAPPKLPDASGPYMLEGFDAQGRSLFTLPFAGQHTADGASGARTFAFAIPSQRAGGDRLARLELTGPGGASAVVQSPGAAAGAGPSRRAGTLSMRSTGRASAQLQWDATRYQAALVRDADTGEVLSIARDGTARLQTQNTRAVQVTFSDGVRTVEKRVRVR